MPLIHSAKKKALQENIKTEMEAHPNKAKRAQNLAIAYSVQRQSKKKKMAKGGEVMHTESMSSPESSMEHQERSGLGDFSFPKKKMAKDISEPVKVSSEHGLHEEHENSKLPHPTHGKMMHEGAQQHKMKVPTDPSMRPSHASSMLEDDSIPHSMAEAIMMKRKERMMAEGGMLMPEDSMEEREDHLMEDMPPHGIDMSVEDHDTIPNSRKKYAMGGEVDLDTNEEEEPNSFYARNEHAALEEDFDDTMHDVHEPEDSNEHNPGDELLEESDEHDMIDKIMKKRKK